MKKQTGFTLIELVIVIVILGILAAVAIPKFVDLSSEANNATAKSIGGSLASASMVNYGAKILGNASAVSLKTANVCTSATALSLVSGINFIASGLPTNNTQYAVSGIGDCRVGLGAVVSCSILSYQGTSQTFNLICTN